MLMNVLLNPNHVIHVSEYTSQRFTKLMVSNISVTRDIVEHMVEKYPFHPFFKAFFDFDACPEMSQNR